MNAFDLPDLFIGDDFMETVENDEAEKKKATAYRTKTKRHARKAKNEQTLDEILPPEIEEGDSWHVLSSGDVDSLSFLNHILKTNVLDYCMFSTWCMAMGDVDQIIEHIEAGRIKACDAYLGEIFPNQYSDEYEKLVEYFKKTKVGRVAVFRNHSKIFLCRSGSSAWVIESSANINTNPRTENTVITCDNGLFNHHKEYFDGIKSFNKEFKMWKPQ